MVIFDSPTRSAGGRSRDPAKDAAIVEAAREAFFDRGFNGATMEDIAVRAGVSKVTVYSRFADKESLFEAVVRDEMRGMVTAFQETADANGTLEARLNSFGVALLSFLFRPQHVAFDRMLAQEFVDRPDLGRRFFDAGPGQCRQRVGAMLADFASAGKIAIDDPTAAAVDLFSLWKGMTDLELKCGVRKPLSATQIADRVARGTRMFLRAVAVSEADVGAGAESGAGASPP